jgi:adenylate cyclase
MVDWNEFIAGESGPSAVQRQVRSGVGLANGGCSGQHARRIMGREIERKFLVVGDAWRASARECRPLKQGYLAIDGHTNVRVRTDGRLAWITVKGRPDGLVRPEFEYEIPAADADGLLALCQKRVVEKTRHLVPSGDHVWEIDEFRGRNDGLTIAEIELRREHDSFERPGWLGAEVTSDPRYLNANLARHPFAEWDR